MLTRPTPRRDEEVRQLRGLSARSSACVSQKPGTGLAVLQGSQNTYPLATRTHLEISSSVQGLPVKRLCLRAAGLQRAALRKDEGFLRTRSRLTAALWFRRTHGLLSSHCCSLILYFSAICLKGPGAAKLPRLQRVSYSICFQTENRDFRARNTGVTVTCRHLLWVAFACMHGDGTALIHHPTPT